jgi:metallo-beta-lactamase class B
VKIPVLIVATFLALGQSNLKPDPPHKCGGCPDNGEREPFKVFGNTYFVGTSHLGAILITSGTGSILVDAGMTQSAALIDAHIRKLGFKTEDIRLIVASHAHFDHVGGIAALQRVSGAEVAALAAQKAALERGEPTPDDPQFGFGKETNGFPVPGRLKVVGNGEMLRVGDLAITPHAVPGHTPGSTAWTWRACEGATCYDIAYVDSLNPVSSPDFKFTGDATHPSRVELFRKSITTTRDLPCDIILAPHASFIGMDAKLAARTAGASRDPFVDPNACKAFAADGMKKLDARVAEERKAK